MAIELLQKEEEYRKINKELEEKSKYLLNAVDNVRKQQETIYFNKLEHLITNNSLSNDTRFERTRVNNKVVEDVPQDVNNIGTKGMTHYFKAKIKKLQEDVEELQNDVKKKNDECNRLIKDNQKLSEEKDKWFQISVSNKAHVTKLENQIAAISTKIQSKDVENLQLKKVIEDLHKQLKLLNVSNGNNETKLLKSNEERDKLKEIIKIMKQDEKLTKDTHKRQVEEMSHIIRRIDKHKNELINGFKKQLQLLDNLKRQKALIEDVKVTEKLEKDFLKILDWNLNE